MKRSRQRKKNRKENHFAIIAITLVVVLLAVTVAIKGASLKKQNKEYILKEESLDAEIKAEEERHEYLEEKKVYVKTKEYIIEKAREVFGLKMPDEIIVRPNEKKN